MVKEWTRIKNGLPDSAQNILSQSYEDLFRLFVKHKDKISRVTFWVSTTAVMAERLAYTRQDQLSPAV